MTATEHVILVDEQDNPTGTAEKITAHRDNLCHRAFSIFIFRTQPKLEVLLQQRANHKYHSPGLWTNTCCSHPRPGEDVLTAGQRRLKEEMNIDTTLIHVGWFHYTAHFNNGLTENEVDHVLIGTTHDETLHFNACEVQACMWIEINQLKQELIQYPAKFTPWLKQAFELAESHF